MYPETFFSFLKQKIRPEWKQAFFSAFFCGLLIHLYRLTNHLLTWDSVYNFHSSQNSIHIGRCFLSISCLPSSYYDLQWIIGLLSLIYLSLTCVLLTEIFSLQKKSSIFLISALTVSFPSVAGTFAYMYTADGYFLAMLLAVLAVFLTLRCRRGIFPAVILLAFSYGTYQAYVSYAVLLILTWSILQLLNKALDWRRLLRHWLRFFCMGAAGTLLYLICNKLLVILENASTSDYNGISTMSFPDGAGLILAVKNCLIDFVYFFFGPLSKISFYQILNGCLFLLLAVLLIQMIRQNRLYQDPGSLLMLFICFAAVPFACSMIYFLSPSVRYYMLMYACFSFLYMLPVLVYDSVPETGQNNANTSSSENLLFRTDHAMKPVLSWFCILLTALTVFNFALIDNISYLYMTASNHMTYELTARMVDRIEQLDEFNTAKKLCIIGHFDDYDTISLSLPPAMAGVRNSYMISEQAHFAAMMETYFGLLLENCSEEEQKEIQSSDMFQQMDCWPAKGSVMLKDGIVIIKINER